MPRKSKQILLLFFLTAVFFTYAVQFRTLLYSLVCMPVDAVVHSYPVSIESILVQVGDLWSISRTMKWRILQSSLPLTSSLNITGAQAINLPSTAIASSTVLEREPTTTASNIHSGEQENDANNFTPGTELPHAMLELIIESLLAKMGHSDSRPPIFTDLLSYGPHSLNTGSLIRGALRDDSESAGGDSTILIENPGILAIDFNEVIRDDSESVDGEATISNENSAILVNDGKRCHVSDITSYNYEAFDSLSSIFTTPAELEISQDGCA